MILIYNLANRDAFEKFTILVQFSSPLARSVTSSARQLSMIIFRIFKEIHSNRKHQVCSGGTSGDVESEL